MFLKLLILPLLIIINVSSETDGDSKCDSFHDCVPTSQCDSYLNEHEKLENLEKGTSDYKKVLSKLKKLICNKKQRKVCCNVTEEDSIPCGTIAESHIEVRISGGENVYPGKYPWMPCWDGGTLERSTRGN